MTNVYKRTWMQEARAKRNLSQVKTAQLVGISDVYYQMIESGNRKPSVALAERLAKVLHEPPERFRQNVPPEDVIMYWS